MIPDIIIGRVLTIVSDHYMLDMEVTHVGSHNREKYNSFERILYENTTVERSKSNNTFGGLEKMTVRDLSKGQRIRCLINVVDSPYENMRGITPDTIIIEGK